MVEIRRARSERSRFQAVVAALTADELDRDEVCEVLAAFVRSLGFDFFSYAAPDMQGAPDAGLVLSSYVADWTMRYRTSGYQGFDPIVGQASRSMLPFAWGSGEYIGALSEDAQALCMWARDYGIFAGLTIPVHGPDHECGVFSAIHARETEVSLDPSEKRYQRLVALAPYVHRCGRKFVVAANEGSAPASLTEHERNCLRWTLQGKTAWEISRIVNRSKPTVEYHLQKAIRKLDASNKTHAAALALKLNLL